MNATTRDARTLTRVWNIVDAWNPVSPIRSWETWYVICPSGYVAQISTPLGAAVEIEEMGIKIVSTLV